MSSAGQTPPKSAPGDKKARQPSSSQSRASNERKTPPSAGPKKGTPRTPEASTSSLPTSPLTPITSKYAAGILPVTYHEDEVTKERIWKILLLVEWRSLEARKCVHPLAGKKEKVDGNHPIKTAVREFHEETLGVFEEFAGLETQLLGNVTDHQLFAYFSESKMYLFFSYVPYYADVQARFIAAKAKIGQLSSEETSQCELFWYPLNDFLRLKGKMTYRHQEVDVAPSLCAARWFDRKYLERALRSIQLITEKRLAQTQSPLYAAVSALQDELNILQLTAHLAETSIEPDSPVSPPVFAAPSSSSSAPSESSPHQDIHQNIDKNLSNATQTSKAN